MFYEWILDIDFHCGGSVKRFQKSCDKNSINFIEMSLDLVYKRPYNLLELQ